jgi:class 3 adenylate cyclase
MASTRRLAAILAADMVGYSRLMGLDEAATVQALREHRAAADPLIGVHGGRIVKTTGDGILIELTSVVGAVECVALQHLAAEHNAGVTLERRMEWRIPLSGFGTQMFSTRSWEELQWERPGPPLALGRRPISE